MPTPNDVILSEATVGSAVEGPAFEDLALTANPPPDVILSEAKNLRLTMSAPALSSALPPHEHLPNHPGEPRK